MDILESGDEAYFIILEWLQQYLIGSGLKVAPDQRNREERVSRLKDFIAKRIRFVLERDEMTITLRSIADRLGLQIEQLKALCKVKMQNLSDQSKRVVTTNLIQEDDRLYLLQHNLQVEVSFKFFIFQSAGHEITFNKRFKVKSNRKCERCSKCLINSSLVIPSLVFLCGHSFHLGCLKGATQCLTCSQESMISK